MEEKDVVVVNAFTALGDTAEKLRLFVRGPGTPGYIILGCWSLRVAQQYIKSSAVVKNWGTSNAPLHMVVINDALSRELIRDCLLHNGVAVEVYERSGSVVNLIQQGTPGNIADFEATLFEFGEAEIQMMSCGAATLVVSGNQIRIGLAVVNTTLRTIMISEFEDVPQFVNLDTFVAQCNLRELVVPSQQLSSDHEACLKRLCERANVTLSFVPKKKFSAADVPRKLGEILRVPEEKMQLLDLPLSADAVGCLIDHSKLHGETDAHSFSMKCLQSSSFMKLDAAAIHALNIVAQGQQEAPRGKCPTTVFAWLNRCVTGMGSRLMRQWLLQPLRNVAEISERHSFLEIMVEAPVVRDALLNQVLRRCCDMDRLNRKLQRRSISLKEIYSFLNFGLSISNALRCLKLYSGQHSRLLNDYFILPLDENDGHLSNLKLLIESTVDIADKETRIKPDFDDDLLELEQQRLAVAKDIDKEYNHVMRKYGWSDKQLKCEIHPSYGYVFRVTRKDDQQVRDSKELTTVSTAKDGVRFLSEKLVALSEHHRSVSKAYQSRQLALKTKLVDTVATYLPVLDDCKELIAQLDVYVAWSVVVQGSKKPMVRPKIVAANSENEGDRDALLSLVNVRHPLVELRQQDFSPNSVKLTAHTNAYVITGPNMGGKSTLMRSVGVAVVMAQAGCFVPADDAEIVIRDAVMCRVGATDHMSQGVSTFMVEMLESAAILSTATKLSLVIIDELGRGTSTYDGFGLAWAIADHVANSLKSALLFSTHFHEMTEMASVVPSVRNMHFGAEARPDNTLRFTYRLEPGPCERSYGIYVAQLAKMPQEVIDEAKQKADELESFEGKTEQWRQVKLEQEVQTRVSLYVKRMREACASADDVAAKQLKDEILADAAVASLLIR